MLKKFNCNVRHNVYVVLDVSVRRGLHLPGIETREFVTVEIRGKR